MSVFWLFKSEFSVFNSRRFCCCYLNYFLPLLPLTENFISVLYHMIHIFIACLPFFKDLHCIFPLYSRRCLQHDFPACLVSQPARHINSFSFIPSLFIYSSHSFIYLRSFIYEVFIECLVWTKHCVRHQKYIGSSKTEMICAPMKFIKGLFCYSSPFDFVGFLLLLLFLHSGWNSLFLKCSVLIESCS